METNFQNAILISKNSIHGLCSDFIDCSVSLFAYVPYIIIFERESSFASTEVRGIYKYILIHLQLRDIESNNSIGKGKTYHYSLKRIFQLTNT